MALLLILTIVSLAYGTWTLIDLVADLRAGVYVPRWKRWDPLLYLVFAVVGASTFARQLLAYRKRESDRTLDAASPSRRL